MIKVDNIRKSFKDDFWSKPNVVLDKITFEINKGELIGFLGVNGAGKTTFLKILMNFIKQDHGGIFFSKDLGVSKSEIFSNMGFLPERPYFYPYLRGREFLNLISELNSIGKKTAESRIKKWTKRLNIEHALGKVMKDYSKGMLQRIGFASVLINNPKVIFLDEPLAGLDPIGRKEFKDIMREINNEGVTVFFSSHIVNDVEEVCSKVIVLEKGGIIYEGLISDLIKKHQSNKYRVAIEGGNIQNIPENFISLSREKNIILLEFEKEEKSKLIDWILENHYNLISLNPKSISLEEVIYRIES